MILPSRTLTPLERVGIYHGMYLLRMDDGLASDYPALQHFLGDDGFVDLVRGYVQAHPSRSYTLNRLGDHLPEYLKTAPGAAAARSSASTSRGSSGRWPRSSTRRRRRPSRSRPRGASRRTPGSGRGSARSPASGCSPSAIP